MVSRIGFACTGNDGDSAGSICTACSLHMKTANHTSGNDSDSRCDLQPHEQRERQRERADERFHAPVITATEHKLPSSSLSIHKDGDPCSGNGGDRARDPQSHERVVSGHNNTYTAREVNRVGHTNAISRPLAPPRYYTGITSHL